MIDRIQLFYSMKSIQVYHQVNLIIPFRDIMVVEKQMENSSLPDLEIQSALLIIAKERVNDFQLFQGEDIRNVFFSRLVHLFSLILLIVNLF